jgi:transketolase
VSGRVGNNSLKSRKRAVAAEEPSVIGGLGGAIAEAPRGVANQELEFAGAQDSFSASANNYEALLARRGLTPEAIVEAVKDALN